MLPMISLSLFLSCAPLSDCIDFVLQLTCRMFVYSPRAHSVTRDYHPACGVVDSWKLPFMVSDFLIYGRCFIIIACSFLQKNGCQCVLYQCDDRKSKPS